MLYIVLQFWFQISDSFFKVCSQPLYLYHICIECTNPMGQLVLNNFWVLQILDCSLKGSIYLACTLFGSVCVCQCYITCKPLVENVISSFKTNIVLLITCFSISVLIVLWAGASVSCGPVHAQSDRSSWQWLPHSPKATSIQAVSSRGMQWKSQCQHHHFTKTG